MTALWIGAAVWFAPSLLIAAGLTVHYLIERRRKQTEYVKRLLTAWGQEQRRNRELRRRKMAALHQNLELYPLVMRVRFGDDLLLWEHEMNLQDDEEGAES